MLLRVHDSARSVSAVQQPPSQPIQQARRPRRCSHVLCCCFLPPSPRVRRLGGLGNPCLCPVALRLRNRNKQLSSAYLRDSTTLIQWCCAPSANLLPARTRKLRFPTRLSPLLAPIPGTAASLLCVAAASFPPPSRLPGCRRRVRPSGPSPLP
jgi:hypothetical protein